MEINDVAVGDEDTGRLRFWWDTGFNRGRRFLGSNAN